MWSELAQLLAQYALYIASAVTLADLFALFLFFVFAQRRASKLERALADEQVNRKRVGALYYEAVRSAPASLDDEDRELVEGIAYAIADQLDASWMGAGDVNVATIPRPILEIEYARYRIAMVLDIEHYEEADWADEEPDEETVEAEQDEALPVAVNG